MARVDSGILHGSVSADHRTFSGIPYAAAPVGSRRWRPPAPPAPWDSTRDATHPGPVCPQLGGPTGSTVVGDEDCLYLNVTTPVRAGDRPRPVLVWLPGGRFVSGAGSDYDATRLAATGDLVVVTVNYRLGALGFLDLPALAATDSDAGNYGLADQRAALRWVRRNIARFGGDPGNVTLAGQSAGGYSVCAQLASPAAAGLFEKVITQSSPCGNMMVTRQVALARGRQAAQALGCATPATEATCLLAIPTARLVTLGAEHMPISAGRIADLPWLPVVDTPALPRQPLDALRRGTSARVPMLAGTTHDEMRPFVALEHDGRGRPVTAAEYPDLIAAQFGARADAILARYPAASYPSPGVALATVVTDWGRMLGACPVLPADRAAAAHAPVYAYEFAEDSGARIAGFPLGAPHGAELPYLFDGAFDGPGDPPLTAPQRHLSEQLIGYWSNFAASDDPNGTGLPAWPKYRGGGRVLSMTAGPGGIAVTDFAQAHHCRFWNGSA
ncbi:carboxylesterase/lipase family protein [Micromonospora sp. NPDC005806]|uniref:carboxylesterase/lipase family protein n=1 Tax=Micromonospora sp. NPDC005806 TaxID=3364234 RepID=UPI0036C76810